MNADATVDQRMFKVSNGFIAVHNLNLAGVRVYGGVLRLDNGIAVVDRIMLTRVAFTYDFIMVGDGDCHVSHHVQPAKPTFD